MEWGKGIGERQPLGVDYHWEYFNLRHSPPHKPSPLQAEGRTGARRKGQEHCSEEASPTTACSSQLGHGCTLIKCIHACTAQPQVRTLLLPAMGGINMKWQIEIGFRIESVVMSFIGRFLGDPISHQSAYSDSVHRVPLHRISAGQFGHVNRLPPNRLSKPRRRRARSTSSPAALRVTT